MAKRVFPVGLTAGLIASFATAILLHFVTTPFILKVGVVTLVGHFCDRTAMSAKAGTIQ